VIGYLVARFSGKDATLNGHLTSLLVKLLVPLLTIYSILTVPSQALLIEAMMPPAVLSVVYAGWFKFNVEKTAKIVTLGTLLLLPELPIVLLLIR
jgi:predicted permease